MAQQDDARPTQLDDKQYLLVRFCLTLGRQQHEHALLEATAQLISKMLDTRGAAVLLLDDTLQRFCIAATSCDGASVTPRFKDIAIQADADMAGEVCRTGRAMIVEDYPNSRYAAQQTHLPWIRRIRTRLDAPLIVQSGPIGVLSAINKRKGCFDRQDTEHLSAVASLAALALENDELKTTMAMSRHRMQAFDQAKNRVIDHVSHALKTPLAVLIASLKLLEKQLRALPDGAWCRVYDRAQRNLERLLQIEYEVEDILRQPSENESSQQPWEQGGRRDPV